MNTPISVNEYKFRGKINLPCRVIVLCSLFYLSGEITALEIGEIVHISYRNIHHGIYVTFVNSFMLHTLLLLLEVL